jgi:uncharacterized membrane protein YGL010W
VGLLLLHGAVRVGAHLVLRLVLVVVWPRLDVPVGTAMLLVLLLLLLG